MWHRAPVSHAVGHESTISPHSCRVICFRLWSMRILRRKKNLLIIVACLMGVFLLHERLTSRRTRTSTDLNPQLDETLRKLDVDEDTLIMRKARYEKYQSSEDARSGPGEKGQSVGLTAEEKLTYDEMYKREAFNKYGSDKISLERSLNDQRMQECRSIVYPKELPSAGVIIIFHNEDWGALLRTAHSVVNRSPPEYLKEVILLDDASYKENLGKPLEDYVSKQWPDGVVRIVRHKERLGLIRARFEGAKAATAEVIIFLDSHCEATKGWIEPLLARIKEDHRHVLCPTIDSISSTDLGYSGSPKLYNIGSFWWSLFFTWDSIPESEIKRRKSEAEPLRSPTMAGGLFAMDRKYFFDLGGYDEGMGIWGGENLELSFRVWTCGGTLEFMPCSHVGHIFRASHPYTFPGNLDYNGINTKRLAEVWLDEYKRLYYMYRPDANKLEAGDFSSRVALRQRLQCKPFQWYLDNIIPQKFVMDRNVTAYGMMSNPATNMCLDYMGKNEYDRPTFIASLYPCQGGKSTQQIFAFTPSGQIRREWACLTQQGHSEELEMRTCHGNFIDQQIWLYDKGLKQISTKDKSRCLTVSTAEKNKNTNLFLRACDLNSLYQKWNFEHMIA